MAFFDGLRIQRFPRAEIQVVEYQLRTQNRTKTAAVFGVSRSQISKWEKQYDLLRAEPDKSNHTLHSGRVSCASKFEPAMVLAILKRRERAERVTVDWVISEFLKKDPNLLGRDRK
ncbi:hypothetical protein BDR26DRAFT_896487 [Obelidium mucronatum]|nr:hypothetical protein BDR26DRAFT_896487 [Obelidium mucronatum]